MSTSARVIKNTTYLYIKMCVSMFISLYTTRLILGALGVSDFGIFNVTSGAIAMFGFLNSTLANATQRFMSYAEGEGNIEKKRCIFNVSVILHIAIALITVLLLLIVMVPLFKWGFNIDPDRIPAAKIVYYCLIFSSVLTIINVPYDAVMNTHENMLYYSIVGIFESLLRLGIAFICVYTSSDKLVLYGILTACIPIITLSIMKLYCHRHYDECVISPARYWDSSIVKQISDFFGWNFLTAISSLFTAQGIGIVLNHFWGTALNAAHGISNQVNGALSGFSVNLMKALNPTIVKNAGAKNFDIMNKATLIGCKFSTLLIILFAVPLCLEVHYVLTLWLTVVPAWATIFVVLQLTLAIIQQVADSASTAIYAQGHIKHYALWKSAMNISPLFITWLAFAHGGGPIWLYIPLNIIWGIGGDIVIIHFAEKQCGLDRKQYIRKVILPIIGTLSIMLIAGGSSVLLMNESFLRLVITCLFTSLGMFVAILLFAVTKEEKVLIINFLGKFIPSLKKFGTRLIEL